MSTTSKPCPKCGLGNYTSGRAMTLHLNNCRTQFQPFSTVIGRKRISNPTIAQRADHILQLMKRPHTSGNQCNLNRLSYPPLVPTVSDISSTVECDQSLELSGVDSYTDRLSRRRLRYRQWVTWAKYWFEWPCIIQTQHQSSSWGQVLHPSAEYSFIPPWHWP